MMKNSRSFSCRAFALLLACSVESGAVWSQNSGNRIAEENLNHVTRQPGAQSEFAPPSKQVQQPNLVLPDLGDISSASLSPVDEKKLGQRIMREIRRDPDYTADPVTYDYLNTLIARLAAGARSQKVPGIEGEGTFALRFELFGVKDKTINAFALPGGFIGVHTGLLVAADTESELASVLGHEMGHVTQKHIARMYGQQGTNSMIALASIILAAIAVSRNPNAAQGIAVGGQALAIQNQLSYSRDAEREADRVGFQILQGSGFDPQGMPDFFARLQRANSIMESGVPGYVRTHPLTTDRIADMQDRVRGLAAVRVPSSIEFYMLKARAQLIQTTSTSNFPELKQYFESLTRKPEPRKQLEGFYGLGIMALKQQRLADADINLQKAKALVLQLANNGSPFNKLSPAIEIANIEILIAKNQLEAALKQVNQLKAVYPTSRSANFYWADIELKMKNSSPVIAWAKQQARINPTETSYWEILARAYALADQKALHHAALAERYVSEGAWVGALEQMKFAKLAGDADFYQSSEIDARARQIQELYRQELREEGRRQ